MLSFSLFFKLFLKIKYSHKKDIFGTTTSPVQNFSCHPYKPPSKNTTKTNSFPCKKKIHHHCLQQLQIFTTTSTFCFVPNLKKTHAKNFTIRTIRTQNSTFRENTKIKCTFFKLPASLTFILHCKLSFFG